MIITSTIFTCLLLFWWYYSRRVYRSRILSILKGMQWSVQNSSLLCVAALSAQKNLKLPEPLYNSVVNELWKDRIKDEISKQSLVSITGRPTYWYVYPDMRKTTVRMRNLQRTIDRFSKF